MAKKTTRKNAAKKTTAKKHAPAKKAAKRPAAKPKPRAAAAAPAASATITAYLCCKGAVGALDFYKQAFGALETMRVQGPDGSIGHAQITIEGAPLMLSDEWPDGGVFSPQTLGGSAVTVHLRVRDVDAFAKRAVAAGATLARAIQDEPYGDRAGTLRDPFGHRWMVATTKREVSKEEMERNFGGAYKVT
ncbi:MAG TPA: VOC family protein [Myxococcota bacterium]|nr:VOC family protein [Myxococcota bacterium]